MKKLSPDIIILHGKRKSFFSLKIRLFYLCLYHLPVPAVLSFNSVRHVHDTPGFVRDKAKGVVGN